MLPRSSNWAQLAPSWSQVEPGCSQIRWNLTPFRVVSGSQFAGFEAGKLKDLAPKPHLEPGVSDTPGFGDPFAVIWVALGVPVGHLCNLNEDIPRALGHHFEPRGSLWGQLEHLGVPFGHPGALRHQPLPLQQHCPSTFVK